MISFSNLRPQRTHGPSPSYQEQMEDSSPSTVLRQSKKIGKSPKSAKISTPGSDSGKRQRNTNETYSHEERENIVSSIRQKIVFQLSQKHSVQELEGLDYVEFLKKLPTEAVDMLIVNTIPQYKPELVLDRTKLGQLRKKIKGWFTTRQTTPSTKEKRSVMLENEIQELNQIAGNAPGYNYGNYNNDYALKIEDMYAKAPIVFEPNMSYNHYWPNGGEGYQHPAYYYQETQMQGNQSLGELMENNGLTTRSNSPLGSPINFKDEIQENTVISDSYMTLDTELEQYWTKYQDDISAGFWDSAKRLYSFGEKMSI